MHWIVLSKNELAIIQSFRCTRKATVRVNVIVPDVLLKETVGFQSTNSLMLHVGGALIVTDGLSDSKTAALLQPYSDEPNNKGSCSLGTGDFVGTSSGSSPQVIHAMGDKAVDEALTVIEHTSKQAAGKHIRFRSQASSSFKPIEPESPKRRRLSCSRSLLVYGICRLGLLPSVLVLRGLSGFIRLKPS